MGVLLYPKENSFDEKENISIIKYIPGLQQIKTKKYLKGGVLLSSFIICITGAVISDNKGNEIYDKYIISKNIDEIIELREKTEILFKRRNLYIIGSGLVFLFHLFDLKFSKEKSGVKGEIKNNSIGIGFYYKF